MRQVRLAAILFSAVFLAFPAAAGLFSDTPFDRAFWKTWGDGKAEVAGYDLTFPRYGAPRRGTAVAVFVTETFSKSLRVKADPGQHPKSDEFPVMKLNLVRDFPTGIYDYNLMTSVFIGLEAFEGLPPGAAAKVSFSAQEWCGHSYEQATFHPGGVELVSHSYFDGEADERHRLAISSEGVSEDALLLWARGFAAPFLKPGETREIGLLRSLAEARLLHRPVEWRKAKLTRLKESRRIQVPAGTFETEVCAAEIEGGKDWTIYVEKSAPRRIVKWTVSDGESGELLASGRLPYWQMNAAGFRSAVRKLGLSPRPARTP